MEIFTVFTANKDTLSSFDDFIYRYPKLILVSKDKDTSYFSLNGPNELYYHYSLNDFEREFSYNYSENDIVQIKQFFDGKEFYFFDLSYKHESFLKALIIDFSNFLAGRHADSEKGILLSHPHFGLIKMSDVTKDW